MKINAQYNVAKPDSLASQITARQRRKMFGRLLSSLRIQPCHSLLDVGVTTDQTYDHSNYIEAWYPHKNRITAVGIDDSEFLESLYPGVKFVRADGRDLPFADGNFDFVHSSAVLEHVGSREEQKRFIREAWRVSRKGIYITTPNRRFPIEFHTALPVVHWLPMPLYRRLLVALGYKFFAEEKNLNLLSRTTLATLAREAGIPKFEIASVSLLGLPTNLILVAQKSG
jgi:ubiquinone/menaquinone biosynthesis C-methylase UbiE